MWDILKLWLAQVGEERFEEIEHPEQAIEKFRQRLRAQGHDENWIEERIRNDLTRNALTDEWKDRGAKEGMEFAILTNELSNGTFGMTVSVYKDYKLLPSRANLRDHMTPIELALTSLSEATAVTFHRERDSQGRSARRRARADVEHARLRQRALAHGGVRRPWRGRGTRRGSAREARARELG